MATNQPNLPDYQLSKAPELSIAMINQMSQNITATMDKMAATTAERRKQRQALNMKADEMSNEFLDTFTKQKGSGVVALDAANRKWAMGTAKKLNELYIDAYGSSGTPEKRQLYLNERSLAMENLNVIGTWAVHEQKNQSAVTLDQEAQRQKSRGLNLLGGSTLSNANLNKTYNRSVYMKNNLTREPIVETDPTTGHVHLKYKTWDPSLNPDSSGKPKGGYVLNANGEVDISDIDMNAENLVYQNTGKDLSYYTITNEDNLNDQIKQDLPAFEKLYNSAGTQVQETKYIKGKDGWGFYKTKTVKFGTLEESDEDGKLTEYLQDRVNGKRFFAKWMQMQNNPNNPLEGLPGSELTWHQANDMTAEELKTFQTKDNKAIYDIDGNDKISRQEINTVQEQTATQGLLNMYQRNLPEGEQILAEQINPASPKDTLGNIPASQIASWKDKDKIKAFNVRSTDTKNVAKGLMDGSTTADLVRIYNNKGDGKRYVSGKEMKTMTNFPTNASWAGNVVDNYVYAITTKPSDQGEVFEKPPTGIELNNIMNNENSVYNYLMSNIYNYDNNDLYFYGDPTGIKELEDM